MDWSLRPLGHHIGNHLWAIDFPQLWGQPYSQTLLLTGASSVQPREPYLRVFEDWSSKGKGVGGALWDFRSLPLPQLQLGPEWLLCKLNLRASSLPQLCCSLTGLQCLPTVKECGLPDLAFSCDTLSVILRRP